MKFYIHTSSLDTYVGLPSGSRVQVHISIFDDIWIRNLFRVNVNLKTRISVQDLFSLMTMREFCPNFQLWFCRLVEGSVGLRWLDVVAIDESGCSSIKTSRKIRQTIKIGKIDTTLRYTRTNWVHIRRLIIYSTNDKLWFQDLIMWMVRWVWF